MDTLSTMSCSSLIFIFEALNGTQELVAALYQINGSRCVGSMDIPTGIYIRKTLIENFVNKISDNDQRCIAKHKDVFYIWLYEKVARHGYEVALVGSRRSTTELMEEFFEDKRNLLTTGVQNDDMKQRELVQKKPFLLSRENFLMSFV
jgi:hypothetical protein